MSYEQMVSRLAVMMGGRVAEELIFGKEKITSGAQSDIQGATQLARAMVTRWGYSDELGLVAYGDNQEEVFLGHSVARTQNVSEKTAELIDSEVRRLVHGGYSQAKAILTEKLEDLHAVAKGLLEYETLSGDEIKALLRGEKPVREDPDEPEQAPPVSSVPKTGRPKDAGGFGPLSPEPAPG